MKVYTEPLVIVCDPKYTRKRHGSIIRFPNRLTIINLQVKSLRRSFILPFCIYFKHEGVGYVHKQIRPDVVHKGSEFC